MLHLPKKVYLKSNHKETIKRTQVIENSRRQLASFSKMPMSMRDRKNEGQWATGGHSRLKDPKRHEN